MINNNNTSVKKQAKLSPNVFENKSNGKIIPFTKNNIKIDI